MTHFSWFYTMHKTRALIERYNITSLRDFSRMDLIDLTIHFKALKVSWTNSSIFCSSMTSQGEFNHFDSELLQTQFESIVRTKCLGKMKSMSFFLTFKTGYLYIIWNAVIPNVMIAKWLTTGLVNLVRRAELKHEIF